MKTFEDLEFVEGTGWTRATLDFDNGYGVSVLTGGLTFTCTLAPYEVAVTYNGEPCYTTDITDNLLMFQDAKEVTEIMKRIQDLPA